jgi:hypothetical protein
MVRANTLLLLVAALLAGCSALPEKKGERRTSTATAPAPPRSLPAPRTGEAAQCLSSLGRMGASYASLPDQYLGQGCTNLNTVQLASVSSDASMLAVTNIGPVTCEVSEVFAAWARYGVDRAARQILGSPLRSIETMGSYACRNVAGTDRRSGHATGAAIDVAGFVLEDGRRIMVRSGWYGGSESERQFLRTVQQSACKRFDTVLGPDYNAAHADHLHVEGVIATKSYCR